MRAFSFIVLLFVSVALSAQIDCANITIKDFLNVDEATGQPYTGECVTYTATGILIQRGSFIAGKKIGLWQSWYSNGQKKTESTYTENVLNGTEWKWFSNGQVESEDEYVKGLRQGKYVAYYETGQTKYEFSFADGLKVGTYTYYHPNGKKWQQGKFSNDLHVGTWWVWDDTGKKVLKSVYKNDELISEEDLTLKE